MPPATLPSRDLEIRRYGLTPVHEDEDPQIDVVLAHGLNGHPRLTWQAANDVFWPADLLPSILKADKIPARILVYGWNANVFDFHGNNATTDMVHHHAQTLIANLVANRRGGAQRRPIVFVGHSLGGILIKRTLNLSAITTDPPTHHSIFVSTYGILFLGTPHTGADPARLGKMLQSMVHAVFPRDIIDTEGNLLETLKTQSETLQNINVDFNRRVDKFHMYFFHESVKTNLYLLGRRLIVDKDSATFLVGNGEYSGIEATHSEMCKYESMIANGCDLVTGAISSYALDAIQDIQRRWKSEDENQILIRHQAARAAIQGLSGGKQDLYETFQALNSNRRRCFWLDSMVPDLPAMISSSNAGESRSDNAQRLSKMLPPPGDKFRPPNKHYYLPRNVSTNFTGRGDILNKVANSLLAPLPNDFPAQQRKFVLYGLGGSGKTQVSLRFAQDNRDRFWGVFWVNASTSETAKQSFAEIAKIGGLRGAFNNGKAWLSHRTDPWLLIIDNADDPNVDISNFFPPGNRGCILITSRNPDCRSYGSNGFHCEVKAMDLEDSITLLLKAAMEDASDLVNRSQAEPIVRELGCLALAIIQAGAAIRQSRCHLKNYLEVYARNHQELLKNHPGQGMDGYKDTVYTTWEISRRMIHSSSSEVSSDAIDFLNISAFLYFEDVPEEILKNAPTKQDWNLTGRVFSWLARLVTLSRFATVIRDLDRIRRALVLLSSFSLITIDVGKSSFSMHPLVHSWTRDRLSEQDQTHYQSSAAFALAKSIKLQREMADYALRLRLWTHVDFLLHIGVRKALMSGSLNATQSQMAAKFALVYSDNGHFDGAEEMYQKALEGMERVYGKEHRDTLQCMDNLATVLRRKGKYETAENLSRRALASKEKLLGKEHPATIKSFSHLALVLHEKGNYSEAEKMNRYALIQRENVLGTQHLDTIESLNNLSSALRSLGRYDEAAKISQRALDAREKILGQEHPDTMESMSDLALVLQSQGNLDAAEKMTKEALERRERVLGKDHPDTLYSVSKLGWIFLIQHKYEEAEEMNRRALNGRERALGPLHPDTLTSVSNLAGVLQSQADYSAAEELNWRALNGCKEVSGLRHPDTFTNMSNLAEVLRNRGKYDAAEEMNRQVLIGRKEVLGPLHPLTLKSMANLALTLENEGKDDEAEKMNRETLSGYEKGLERLNPDILSTMSNLAWVLHKQKKYKEAEEMSRRALHGYEVRLGPTHPETLFSVFNLAYLLHTRKQYDDAYRLYWRACEGYKERGLDYATARKCSKYFSSLREEMESRGVAEPSIGHENLAPPAIQEIQVDTSNSAPDLQQPQHPAESRCTSGQPKRRRSSSFLDDVGGSDSKKQKVDKS